MFHTGVPMFRRTVVLSLIALIAAPLMAQNAVNSPKKLLEADANVEKRIKVSSAQVSVAKGDGGIDVTIQGGKEGYPGIDVKPDGEEVWNLSGYGHVFAQVQNTGAKPLAVALRVDNKGAGESFNTESTSMKPGETKTIKVIFGFAYGGKPSFKLDPEKVNNVKLFLTSKSEEIRSFKILSIEAGGVTGEVPPVNPDSIRVVPPGGVIVGDGAKLDPKQIAPRGNATASIEGNTVKATFTGKADQAAVIKPVQGKWRLADFTEVRVKVKNTGSTPVTPQARVESPAEPSHNRGPTPWAKADELKPGATAEIVVPFGGNVWDGSEPKKTGNTFQSDKTNSIAVAVGDGKGELTIESIVAANPPAQLSEWIGKKPPVDGQWTQTFNENFDKPLDFHTWEVYTANYWDKRSYFSKNNVIVEDGVAKLRFEKKRGFHNDDPETKKELDYATGFLSTYGKWTQKYGYFEARMKLPSAPGMWPAFWMMPDRGYDKGEQWKRADTKNGGMEFDIMEHLSRWGPARYNVAMHWDGYQKEHKATGSEAVYVQPDKDGYIISGVLWEPGKLTFYGNGQVVAKWENERICNQQMYLIFTAVSGGWDNDPIDDAKLPTDFTVDWVRAWQKKDWATSEDGPKENDGGLKGPQK